MPGVKVYGDPHAKGSLVCKGPRKCPGCRTPVPHRVLEDDPTGKGKVWRANVTLAAKAVRAKLGGRMTGPVVVEATFVLARPLGHYGTGRNAGTLRPSAPEYPTVKPDADKLVRMILDALTDADLWEDDARVVDLDVRKRYPSPDTLDRPGVILHVEQAPTRGGLL